MRQVTIRDFTSSIYVRQDEIDDFIEEHTSLVTKKSRTEDRSVDDVAASLVAAKKVSDAMAEIDTQTGFINIETETI